MARIDSITIGKGQGSLGNVTLRKTKDGTIASQKISKGTQKVGTYNQTVRRVMLSNLVNAYKQLLTLSDAGLKVAFTRKPTNESDFNAFVRMNMAKSSVSDVKLTKEEAAAGMVCPAPFIITDGSLLAPQSLQELYTAGKITLPLNGTLSDLGDLGQALVNMYGCKQGDTITFLTMRVSEVDFAFHVKQFQIDINSSAALPSWVSAAGVITLESNSYGSACVVIRGRSENGQFDVSPSAFGDEVLTSTDYAEHITQSYEQLAVSSYGYKASPFLQIPVTNANSPAPAANFNLVVGYDADNLPADALNVLVDGERLELDPNEPTKTFQLPAGTNVQVSVEVNSGWIFKNWNGDPTLTDPDVDVTMSENMTFIAHAEEE